MTTDNALLRVRELVKRFGALAAVDRVDLSLARGERCALIGPNGAGKTTLIHLVSGALRPEAGRIEFGGEDITGWPAHRRARAGLVRTFQIGGLFPQLTVSEQLEAALMGGRLKLRRAPSSPKEIEQALARHGLAGKGKLKARELSHGDRRLLELTLALALSPQLLLLDEPTAGLSQGETRHLIETLSELSGITLLIVEHDMDVVFRLAERILVMHQGRVLAAGPPEEVARDSRVQSVYLRRS